VHACLVHALLAPCALLLLSCALNAQNAGTLLHDFDHDGAQEKLVSGPGGNEILRLDAASGVWHKAGYNLPEGVSLVDADGKDAGLRFVDLNADGFEDLLYSDAVRYAIYLWNKDVQPHLGWSRGWSQEIRSGVRAGSPNEPPPLIGAHLRADGDQLHLTWPDAQPPRSGQTLSAKALIAFDMPPPKSPEEALRAFHVRAGFQVELAAAEPLVLDPIAFDWDAAGRLWVVEMGDYPQGLDGHGKPGGVVKVLEDRDSDGRYDRVTLFLEGVPFPTSVMPWRRGALIAAAPDLFYAEDTDGDGKADVRTVLFQGFVAGNQQHRINGFEWGLDGWIYAANGDSGGTVTSLKTGVTLSISGRDVRFRPDAGSIETVSAQSQFGRRRDDWGHWFGNNNPTWLWHVTLPEHYLRRNPKLAVRSVARVLANYPDSTRVFPTSPPMIRPNQPWALNHVTSACSPTPYRDDLFGQDFATSVFISEPVHNAVHREVLEREGAGFASRRAPGEEKSEFLSSSDPWFRPVTIRTGPDGALYIADMYRFVIEHPEWIPPEMRARLNLRAGEDRGRIYRVVPAGTPRRRIPNLAALDVPGLIDAMNSPSGWQRDTVQRLLLERGDREAIPPLTRLLGVAYPPKVRLQSLATLGLLEALSTELLTRALVDPHPAVRSEALRQSETVGLRDEALFRAVAARAADGDAEVRLQAAFSLGAWPSERREPVLQELLARNDVDETLRVAVLSSLDPARRLFATLSRKDPGAATPPAYAPPKPSSEDRAQALARYRTVGRLKGDPVRGRAHYQTLCTPCHRLRDEGHEVGPDLANVSSKPIDWLLAAILDPNQAMDVRYRGWHVVLKSGEEWSGLLSAETANNLVIRLPGGVEQAVLREDIAAAEPLTVSLMPTGFESALKPQDMADLLRWLRTP
jgi:putative membrane-bound dehydrogenase-like protein